MTYHYSRLQRLRWRIGDLLGKLLLTVAIIGVVEAAQQCGPGSVPVLEGIGTIVVIEGGRIDFIGVPEWGCMPTPTHTKG